MLIEFSLHKLYDLYIVTNCLCKYVEFFSIFKNEKIYTLYLEKIKIGFNSKVDHLKCWLKNMYFIKNELKIISVIICLIGWTANCILYLTRVTVF